MTTVQIIGIAVAGAAVLLLAIALIVSRRRPDDEDTGASSFLDEAPQDTFAGLGKAEQPVEDITLDPALQRAQAAEAARVAAEAAAAGVGPAAEPALGPEPPQPAGLGLDWHPDLSVRELRPESSAVSPWGDEAEDEVTREIRFDEEITGEIRPAASSTPMPQPAADPPAEPAAESGDQAPAARLVPLSAIIVTTSNKMVDLGDPEVRRMLTDLMTFEIDQADEYRRQGQGVDAILQLTEAEKVARALGMADSAGRIRAMMKDIRRSE